MTPRKAFPDQPRWPDVPGGFRAISSGGPTLVAREVLVDSLTARGMHTPAGWERLLDSGSGSRGRGAIQRVEVPGGALVVKQMRRGGVLAPLWQDRYPGVGRLWDNLVVPLSVMQRGIATASPAALLIAPGPPGLYRGWLATWHLDGAEDLARRFASGATPRPDQLDEVLGLVRRMHDAGIEHPDLNLGNLMIRESAGKTEAFVLDLDRVRLHDTPLDFALRQSAVRRLERSFVKLFGPDRPAPEWYDLYAAGDPALAERFRRGRTAGRLLQRLHRLGWR